ncbi:hypothetical protein ACS0TY_026938 [Phlomoides rotata]
MNVISISMSVFFPLSSILFPHYLGIFQIALIAKGFFHLSSIANLSNNFSYFQFTACRVFGRLQFLRPHSGFDWISPPARMH